VPAPFDGVVLSVVASPAMSKGEPVAMAGSVTERAKPPFAVSARAWMALPQDCRRRNHRSCTPNDTDNVPPKKQTSPPKNQNKSPKNQHSLPKDQNNSPRRSAGGTQRIGGDRWQTDVH